MAIASVYDESYPFKDAPYWNDLEEIYFDLKVVYMDLTLVDPLSIPSPLYINDLQ